MEVSDSASYYVDVVDRNYVSGKAMTLVGTLMWVGGILAVEGFDRDGQRGRRRRAPHRNASTVRPIAIPGNHARAGTVLGSLAGAVGGLAATAGMDSSQTTEGLSITLALTAVGGLIGHEVGEAIDR